MTGSLKRPGEANLTTGEQLVYCKNYDDGLQKLYKLSKLREIHKYIIYG